MNDQGILVACGDLPNHNTVGLFNYTKGSLERSIDLAQRHLDFLAFTGHAQWHDMPAMPGGVEAKWGPASTLAPSPHQRIVKI